MILLGRLFEGRRLFEDLRYSQFLFCLVNHAIKLNQPDTMKTYLAVVSDNITDKVNFSVARKTFFSFPKKILITCFLQFLRQTASSPLSFRQRAQSAREPEMGRAVVPHFRQLALRARFPLRYRKERGTARSLLLRGSGELVKFFVSILIRAI